MNTSPIGIFDSGLGGLTIFKTISQALPHENLIYFGDTMNVPYGSKSKEAITRFSLAIAQFLQTQKVKLIVVACNTASALALPQLQKQISVPIIGVIEPGAQKAYQSTKNGKIAVLATEATIRSCSYVKALKHLNKNLQITQQACPVFVPLIEEGWIHPAAGEQIIADYLKPVIKSKADTVILGCTHYPVIKQRIAKQLGKKVQLVDSAAVIAEKVKSYLSQSNQFNPRGHGKLTLYVSDDPTRFKKLAKYILGRSLPRVLLKKLNS